MLIKKCSILAGKTTDYRGFHRSHVKFLVYNTN